MDKKTVIQNLRACHDYVFNLPKQITAETAETVHNIVLGCAFLVKYAEGDFPGWTAFDPKRKRQVYIIAEQQTRLSLVARGVIFDLIDYTIDCLKTADWLDDVSPAPLPIFYEE